MHKIAHPYALSKQNMCVAAARDGYLTVLQWARENGCTWDDNTCDAAAAGGHLDVIIWAVKNGCRLDENFVIYKAEIGGHRHIIRWLNECYDRYDPPPNYECTTLT